ncbi:MAG TPA: DUF6069 family protein [Nocardioidaceae bacterium]|nr:DUF6069 family protein [Nocardioidaceae bacterium]
MQSVITPVQTTEAPRAARGARLVAVAASTAAALAAWVVAGPVLGVEIATLTAADGGSATVGAVAVVVSAAVTTLAGWALLAALERFTRAARRSWTVIAGMVLLVSLIGPATLGSTAGSAVGLVVMHLVVGATAIPLLARTARR